MQEFIERRLDNIFVLVVNHKILSLIEFKEYLMKQGYNETEVLMFMLSSRGGNYWCDYEHNFPDLIELKLYGNMSKENQELFRNAINYKEDK